MTCPNCQTMISCSCQMRTANDGKQCCTNCVSNYENSIVNKKSLSIDDLNKLKLQNFTR